MNVFLGCLVLSLLCHLVMLALPLKPVLPQAADQDILPRVRLEVRPRPLPSPPPAQPGRSPFPGRQQPIRPAPSALLRTAPSPDRPSSSKALPVTPRLPDNPIPTYRPSASRLASSSLRQLPQPVAPVSTPVTTEAIPSAPSPTPSPPIRPGLVPERSAVPKTSFPNKNIRLALDRTGVKTSVEVLLRISAEGSVEVSLLEGSGVSELDEAVLKDLAGWRWEPARAAGRAVPSERQIRLRLEGD